jgi:hypothetical protein
LSRGFSLFHEFELLWIAVGGRVENTLVVKIVTYFGKEKANV